MTAPPTSWPGKHTGERNTKLGARQGIVLR